MTDREKIETAITECKRRKKIAEQFMETSARETLTTIYDAILEILEGKAE